MNSTSAQLLSAIYPNVTIGRTLLNDSSLVDLEGNKSQVLVWTRDSEQTSIRILNQAYVASSFCVHQFTHLTRSNVTVQNSSQYANILVNTISSVLTPPAPLFSVIGQNNLSTFGGIISSVPAPAGYFTNGQNGTLAEALNATGGNTTSVLGGYTIFVPNDTALVQAQGVLGELKNNASALQAVLGNHFINGSTVYSTELESMGMNGGLVSASGELFVFTRNASGLFVGSGQNANESSTAMIVTTDILTQNGVLHVIDRVLVDTQSDPSAASSA